MSKLFTTHAAAAVIIIRLMVGAVFVSEGIQKFLYPAEVGAGRFEKIGIPSPEIVAPIVASFEIGCGCAGALGPRHAGRRGAARCDHAHRDRHDENSHPDGAGVLEDGSRVPHRLVDAAGFSFLAAGWWWRVVRRCVLVTRNRQP